MTDENGLKLSKRDNSKGLQRFYSEGIKAPKVLGLLAESINLVPKGAEITPSELLSDLRGKGEKLDSLFSNT